METGFPSWIDNHQRICTCLGFQFQCTYIKWLPNGDCWFITRRVGPWSWQAKPFWNDRCWAIFVQANNKKMNCHNASVEDILTFHNCLWKCLLFWPTELTTMLTCEVPQKDWLHSLVDQIQIPQCLDIQWMHNSRAWGHLGSLWQPSYTQQWTMNAHKVCSQSALIRRAGQSRGGLHDVHTSVKGLTLNKLHLHYIL